MNPEIDYKLEYESIQAKKAENKIKRKALNKKFYAKHRDYLLARVNEKNRLMREIHAEFMREIHAEFIENMEAKMGRPMAKRLEDLGKFKEI